MKNEREQAVKQKLQAFADEVGKVDLWPTIAARINPRRARFILVPRLAILPLVVLVLVSVLAWFSYLKPVSAAEILDRAQRATQNTSQFGLISYSGVIDGKMRFPDVGNSKTPLSLKNTEWIYWQNHLWFAAPDKQRIEFYVAEPQQGNVPRMNNEHLKGMALSHFTPHADLVKSLLEHVTVKVAQDKWDLGFAVDTHGAKETVYHSLVMASFPDYQSYEGMLLSTDHLTGADDLDHATKFLSTRFDHVTLQGEVMLAGRPAYLVLFTALKPDKKFQFDDEIVTAWYDKQTYMLLGLQLQVKIDDQFQMWGDWRFSSFEANPTLAPETFIFTPPADVPIVEETPVTPSARPTTSATTSQ